MSIPEASLLQLLRRRPGGFAFRRPHPFDPYAVDFCCAAARLVVEIDGARHGMGDNPHHVLQRDASMREKGLHVLRLDADDVMKGVETAETAILLAVRR